jgi:mRNA interferase MazF
MELAQYNIVLVNLDPTIGSEVNKTRPCVVISPDEMNRHLRTIVIAPMTTSVKDYPTRVKVLHNKQEGSIVLDQIRTIDKKRILKVLGKITAYEISACKKVIAETYVD